MRNDGFWTWFDLEARPKLIGRADTFAKMFEHLDQFDRPVIIIETGCARRDPADPESWSGDGCSTIMFDRYAAAHKGSMVYSVDLDLEAVTACAGRVGRSTAVACRESIGFLRALAGSTLKLKADLLYLDSHDFKSSDPLPSAIHHHAELMAAMPIIRHDTLVVVDDSPVTLDNDQHAEVGGKGLIVARHMALCGADFAFCSYQTGWTNVGPARKRDDLDIADLIERARQHVERDDAVAAEALYRLILGLTTPPKSGRARVAHGEACAFYAKMALARQRHGTAADWYREALMADPHATDYRLELITKCFLPMGSLRSALMEAERATKISPDYPAAWKMLGGVHHEMNNAAKAIEAYERQLALGATADALLDRATIALDTGDYDRVIQLCEQVTDPDRVADALHCVAMVAYRSHEHEIAIGRYDAAIKLGCRDPATAQWNKSLALHAIGRYREGWEAHEHRADQRGNPALYIPMRRFTLPRWNGEPALMPDGSITRLHVHYEAGAGDNLCMVRYVKMLADQGYRVRYECADEMVGLIRDSMPDVSVFPKAKDYPGALGIEPFDYHVPIGSLPAIFKTDIDSVPWGGRYLKANANEVWRLRHEIDSGDPSPKVGFCWSSGIREGIWMREYGLRKSMHFDTLAPLIRLCMSLGIAPVSLQIGPERAQHCGVLFDVLSARPDWAETAALIEALDLVVTVDTAVAHLAGAMGKPVWLMSQRDACSWHFMCWRPGSPWNEASPWYPSMRVFRPNDFTPHRWDDVIAAIEQDLRKWQRAPRKVAE